MSFILEALKKSEQQRQEKNASQQQVRNRTLSLTPGRSARRSYWLLAGLLSLVLLCGWWAYSELQPTPAQAPEPVVATPVPPAIRQPIEPEPVLVSPAPVVASASVVNPAPVISPAPETSAPQQPVAVAEPAPVPNIYVSPPRVRSTASPAKDFAPAVKSQRVDVVVAVEKMETEEQVATVDFAQEEPQAADPLSLLPSSSQMPTYNELSEALRDRIPAINMSMHFYNREPNRRLVRINDRLLHEGDWVDRDLQLVEITVTGVILDFLGKLFEMRSARR